MGEISELGRNAWRKYNQDGVSASGFYKPEHEPIFKFVDSVQATADDLQTQIDTASELATAGIKLGLPVDLATTGPVTLSGEQTVDGELTGSRSVMVKDNTPASQNGIYDTGAGAWTRRADANTSDELLGWAFQVLSGTVNSNIVFRVTNTAAITVGTTAINFSEAFNLSSLSSQLTELEGRSGVVATTTGMPVAVDPSGDVGLWFDSGGRLGARALSPDLEDVIFEGRVDRSSGVPGSRMPLVMDSNGRVPLWLENGRLDAIGLSDGLLAAVLGSSPPFISPRSATCPAATDGRSLMRWRGKAGLIAGGDATVKLRIGIIGDSWAEYTTIPSVLRAALEDKWANAGEGWISVNTLYKLNGVTLSRSGWTFVDASATASFPNGVGPDGHNIHATGTSATLSISNCTATDFTILYQDLDGTFRWRIDGGSWTTVVCGDTGDKAAVVIPSLSDADHTLSIDLTGNTGTVSIHGFVATRNVGGVELYKLGNAAIRSDHINNYYGQIGPGLEAAGIELDAMIVILGTNDYQNSGSPPGTYTTALDRLGAQIRSASADVGMIYVAPADTNGDAITALTAYRDALYNLCVTAGYEFYNMHDLWGTWPVYDALGLWTDDLHVNSYGATTFVSDITRRLSII